MAAVTSSMRVLILSADLGSGHDAAARAIAADILATQPQAVVRIENGLRLASPFLHHLVRDGYKLQITYASPTYALLFRLVSLPLVARVLRWLLALCFGRHFFRAVRAFQPDVVISTYPVVTALLGQGRRRGALWVPAVAVVTDVDPSPWWLAPGIDWHYVAAPGDVARVRDACGYTCVSAARPPIRPAFLERPDPAAARARLDLPAGRTVALVSGGGWGVGSVESVVGDLVAGTDAFLVVACGNNESLRRELSGRYARSRLLALPFWDDMPGLFAACDVLIHTGAGLTCLEALASGLPVVLYHVLPGHGVRSARALSRDGAVRWARTPAELMGAVAACARLRHDPTIHAHASSLRRLPRVADTLPSICAAAPAAWSSPPIHLRKPALITAVLLTLAGINYTPVRNAYPHLAQAAQVIQTGVHQVERRVRPASFPVRRTGRYPGTNGPWRGHYF